MQVENKRKINENGSPGPETPGPGDKWGSLTEKKGWKPPV